MSEFPTHLSAGGSGGSGLVRVNMCPFEWVDSLDAWWCCDLPAGHDGDHESFEGGGSRAAVASPRDEQPQ